VVRGRKAPRFAVTYMILVVTKARHYPAETRACPQSETLRVLGWFIVNFYTMIYYKRLTTLSSNDGHSCRGTHQHRPRLIPMLRQCSGWKRCIPRWQAVARRSRRNAAYGLVEFALPGVNLENLQPASTPAVLDTLPVVALAFVYQNVVSVVVTNLEGDVRKVRLAIWMGLAIPLVMFVAWEGAMLGSNVPGVHH
jgi:hypothetical protein